MKKFTKKIVAILGLGVMTVSLLSGCKNQNNSVQKENTIENKITVAGYEVTKEEIMTYCILQLLSGKMTYNDVTMNVDYYKSLVLNKIRDTKVIYDIAIAKNMEFTPEDEKVLERLILSFKTYIPQETFDKYGIDDETIRKVFIETSYADKYENDKRNELGKELTADYIERFKGKNFQNIYQIVFPIVEADENNQPVVDADGNLKKLSEEKIAEVKANAEAAMAEINSGKDAHEVAKAYNVDVYSEETSGYVGIYSDEMNEVLGKLEAGQCTELYETEAAFYFIVVISNNDQKLLESFAYTMALDNIDAIYTKEKSTWFAGVATDTDAEVSDTFWPSFDFLDMATYLSQKGLMR